MKPKRYGSRQSLKTEAPRGLLDDVELLDILGAFSPMLPAALLGDPFDPTEAMAGEDELLQKYKSGEIASVFPQPFKSGGPEYGRYLQMPERIDITDKAYAAGYIDASSGTKPVFRVAEEIDPRLISQSSPGTYSFSNLYKNPPIKIKPDGYPDKVPGIDRRIISTEFKSGDRVPGLLDKSGDHIYSLAVDYDTPFLLQRDASKVSGRERFKSKMINPRTGKLYSDVTEPFMRPAANSKIELGEKVGELGSGKSIFDKIIMYMPRNFVKGF